MEEKIIFLKRIGCWDRLKMEYVRDGDSYGSHNNEQLYSSIKRLQLYYVISQFHWSSSIDGWVYWNEIARLCKQFDKGIRV